MVEIKLPPFEVEELKGIRLLEAQTNWAFKHFKVREIHKITTGRNVRVAVLDTGRPEHGDIKVAEAVDFTGEGVVDKQGHSTWVSGCIKAKGGFLGWAPECKLFTAKILDNGGEGAWLWMRKGLEWALEERFDIVNISAGGSYGGTEIQSILARMAELGMLVVCAAGNTADLLIYPASDPSTIAVGSVNKELERSAFSGFGHRLITMAPGEDLLGCWLNNGYAKSSGTSMSSPQVVGLFTLQREIKHVGLKETVTRLAISCLDMDAKGHDWVTGWGLIEPFKFLGLEPGKKITIDWIFKFIFFVLIYFFVGAPTAAMKKISKYFGG